MQQKAGEGEVWKCG